MTQRTPGPDRRPAAATWERWRRRLRRHRRTAAATLTFVAVLSAGAALRPSTPAPTQPGDGSLAARLAVPAGLVGAPVRVEDPSVAGLVGVGDLVDVVAADARGRAAVVAADAVVVWRASDPPSDFGPEPSAGTVLVVAVDEATALSLAAATTTSRLSLLVPSDPRYP
jgi:hypothetical protein